MSSDRSQTVWDGIKYRCKDSTTNSYKGCTISEKWSKRIDFIKWFEENFKPEFMQKWQLDKDLLIPGNKVYGPDTCCFLPSQINTLLKTTNRNLPTGVGKDFYRYYARIIVDGVKYDLGRFSTPEEASAVYKIAKEKHIREAAEKFRELLPLKVYNTLINYKVR